MNTASHELARTLLRKAEIDLLNATVLRNSSQRNREGVGLHVQQAVEKSLTAILAFHQIHYPKTHVISGLVRLASDNDIELRIHSVNQIAIRFMRWVSGMTNLALTKNLTLMRQ